VSKVYGIAKTGNKVLKHQIDKSGEKTIILDAITTILIPNNIFIIIFI
jgi:hypothetical protein